MKTPALQIFSSAILALTVRCAAQCFNPSVTYSSLISLTPGSVQYTSCNGLADGPKLYPIDATSYDWWYFDAVSKDGTEAVTLIFFTTAILGFPDPASVADPLNVVMMGTFADGSTSTGSALATSVTVDTVGNGASGNWTGTGCSFEGTADLSRYTITIDSPAAGISGTVELVSRGPGHYPCSPLVSGANELLMPHVGWANVMPAADATVSLKFDGRQLNFEGNGYHDKNWGDIPFETAVQSWYWGHGSFGCYELVFFDAIDSSGVEHVSGYVLENGHVIGSTCTTNSGLQVRPVNSPYPPTLLTPNPTEFSIYMSLNNGGTLNATITPVWTQENIEIYTRWFGHIDGTVDGVTASGSALWEQFKLAA